jgi:hypothetical protein
LKTITISGFGTNSEIHFVVNSEQTYDCLRVTQQFDRTPHFKEFATCTTNESGQKNYAWDYKKVGEKLTPKSKKVSPIFEGLTAKQLSFVLVNLSLGKSEGLTDANVKIICQKAQNQTSLFNRLVTITKHTSMHNLLPYPIERGKEGLNSGKIGHVIRENTNSLFPCLLFLDVGLGVLTSVLLLLFGSYVIVKITYFGYELKAANRKIDKSNEAAYNNQISQMQYYEKKGNILRADFHHKKAANIEQSLKK